MENNEISMFMDTKLDIHDKRPDSLRYKTWTKCEVKIEAIKCLPCFLRITFQRSSEDEMATPSTEEKEKSLSVSINVPGVTISLATSRTKQHSYGLFWTQNRRACFIYFALETEASCRRHMKWIKKSIKNLELYRQVFLEQRRSSRGSWRFGAAAQGVVGEKDKSDELLGKTKQLREMSSLKTTLGPLPKIPDTCDANISSWSRRISRASDIYEEIFEGSTANEPPRLSRRFSRTSIASGIYEEMKPSPTNFNAIVEETPTEQAPPLPPLPPPRKRINTFETSGGVAGLLGEIPRSNTNPESELAKKKKYKNVLDNIFGSGRAKRAESVSESQACSAEDLLDCITPPNHNKKKAIYADDAHKRQKHPHQMASASKRNSFSSPDLSKINYLDNLDEDQQANAAALLLDSFAASVDMDLNLTGASLDESNILTGKSAGALLVQIYKSRIESQESLNISEQIPTNFNFSACNTSTINLIGAISVNPLPAVPKNKIVIDDVTGYCFMAPIVKKLPTARSTDKVVTIESSSTSSGYSTGSYCSSTSSTTEEHLSHQPPTITEVVQAPPCADESAIYEHMMNGGGTSLNASSAADAAVDAQPLSGISSPAGSTFTGNLYENLLTVKAAQELEQLSGVLSTSTPTDSPQMTDIAAVVKLEATEEEESYYQTPRKSIISVDDKIPSYYPNSCDTIKTRRQSPTNATIGGTPTSSASEKSSTSIGLRHLVNMKMRRERKENLYISSPQKIIEQRHNSTASTSSTTSNKSTKSTHKNKKTGAHKISENVYAVTHPNSKKSSNSTANNNNQASNTGFTNEMKEKLQTELLQLAMLQNIDFKFDDTKALETLKPTTTTEKPSTPKKVPAQDEEYENCFQTTASATRLLNKYATLARFGSSSSVSAALPMANSPPQHHLQLNQASNTKSQTPIVSEKTQDGVGSSDIQLSGGGVKKFASLPRFKKIDFSPLKMRINNVLQRNQHHEF